MSDQELELYSIIGKLLSKLREDKGLTAVDVSKSLDNRGVKLTDTSIRRYESGKHRINMKTLKTLCDLYGANYMEVIKDAKIKSIKETDSSCNVYCKSDPNPISKTYGEDGAKLLYYFNQLNSEGKELVMKQAEAFSQLTQYTTEKKGTEKMA